MHNSRGLRCLNSLSLLISGVVTAASISLLSVLPLDTAGTELKFGKYFYFKNSHFLTGHLRMETWGWSQCASESRASQWMMECWPPGVQEIENYVKKLEIKIFDYHNLKIRTDDILLVCSACHGMTVAGHVRRQVCHYSWHWLVLLHTCFLTLMCLCLIRTRAWWMDLASPSLKTWQVKGGQLGEIEDFWNVLHWSFRDVYKFHQRKKMKIWS